ncbi:AraC family transcriptional regulator [Pseudomonas sp. GD03860]|uniref:AraC-like transcriptional regulator QhpR n=1 Tax=Pseudomonas TaxID=286 RepID=UPI00236499DA|nr:MULTISPECIES: AraC family transcriptional regulator [Pseudomonas]MDD2058468.1 AraC family transcriptional regulator [Pseudomonas putida]MDH0640431.1 AraC family transcriptional regulator [Pseudomonas sp. GD03860]
MSKFNTHTIFAENFFRRHKELFAPYLAEAGLDEHILYTPEAEIPVAQYVALWELLGARVSPSIGLQTGLQTDSSVFGAYGHAIRSAPTMDLVLRCLSHFIVVFTQATNLSVEDDGKHVLVMYQITDPCIVQRRQDAEFSIGAALSVLREVTRNPLLMPVRVNFEHHAPVDQAQYREAFSCAVHFSQPDNRLYFSRDILDMPVCTADPRLFQALEPFLEAQRKCRAAATHLLSRLGHHIASSLSSGGASLEQVANSMGIGPRTLQRRLSDHQVEFSQMVEEVRRSLAADYVARNDYSLTEIALLLGYAETSSFSRAFRRWTRLTPQQYRKQAHHLASDPRLA